ncbi:MAG: ROK family protein, partial [Sediminibacterium sp.]|nr:ROK family protein [Sediminibacterium sp.]
QFNMPCKVTNDANAAAMGEMQYGAAKSMKNFIMITLGTGVGSGIVVDGNIVYGHDGFAGELGHIIIIPNGRIHLGTQIRGSLESYCSATGVRVTALEKLAETDRPSLLRNVSAEELTSKYIFEAALQGDEIAKEIFQFTGEILGIAFANFIMTTSPEAIILYGGLARSGELLIRPLKITMENHLLKIFKGKVKILLSHLKSSDAAILGASALMW